MNGAGADEREVVAAIYEAFNRRDPEAVIELSHPEIVLHPLRIIPQGPWRGHAGIRALFEEMQGAGLVHTFVVAGVEPTADGRLAALGHVETGGLRTPFVGVHVMEEARIRRSEHYFSDAETLARLGVFEPCQAPPCAQRPVATGSSTSSASSTSRVA